MSASVLFVGIVIVIGVVCAFVITPILLIPAALIVLTALFAAPFLGMFGRMIAQSGDRHPGTGTPSTSDATYDPVDTPPVTPRQ